MKSLFSVPVAGFLLMVALLGQNRAVMEPPIIKGSTDTISFTARFSELNPEKAYRIGVGVGSGALEGATISLETEAGAVNSSLVDFTQGNTSSWWGVSEVSARGFLLEGASIPSEGVTLRVSIPRSVADKVKKLYVFVAKKYGPTTWYLEDGSELSDEYW